ncbi:hypothetical protein ABW19_dt0208623 [Dactylella cylindrospora]|nr:hypothetical protein ABW19_dt0208623 [Dactylella cylindrospora]
MSSKYYEFNVEMTCGGCSGAVDRSLKKWTLDGEPAIEESQADWQTKIVKVKAPASVPYQDIYDRIAGTGKAVLSGKEVDAWEA